MLYLIVVRCRTNIGRAMQEVKSSYGEELSAIFNQKLDVLKKRIDIRFDNVSGMLSDAENKYSSIIKEKFIKLVSKK